MNVRRRRVVVLFPVCLLLLCSVAVAAPRHHVSINYPGATTTFGFGINASGDIVGGYVADGVEHGYALRNGVFESFDYPGAAWTEAEGINPAGDIVGMYGRADNTTHGFLLSHGIMKPFEVPNQPTETGPANTMPQKISPEGVVVGCFHQSAPTGATIQSKMFGFAMTVDGPVSPDADARTMHMGINPSGVIVGNAFSSTTGTAQQSYIIDEFGVKTSFRIQGARITRATDINASGTIVGFYRDAANKLHGFTMTPADISNGIATVTTVDADFAGVKATQLSGVNPSGEMVGSYSDAAGTHAFVIVHGHE